MKYTKFRFLSEASEADIDDRAINYDEPTDDIDTLDDQSDVMSDLTIADVRRMFKAGELDYDTLLKYLMSDRGDGELDDLDLDDTDLDGIDDEFDMEYRNKMQESAPPDEEDWIKKMKPSFTKRYGKKKGLSTLYATAWKRHQAVKEAWGDELDDEFDDEDDLTNAERELIAKSERALKKRGTKVDDFDPDEVPAKPDQKKAPKANKQADAEQGKKKDTEEKKEAPTRTRGKPIGERGGNIRSWFKENPNASRKDFMTKASELGMGAKHANTLYYTLKRKMTECYFIGLDGKYLTEGSSLVSPKFINLTESGELLAFNNKRDAYRMVDILRASGKAVFVV